MISVAASAIVRKDNAILFIRETKPSAKDRYGLPGGKLEDGETLEQCAIREFKEEVGLDIRIKDLVAGLAPIQKPIMFD
jgi:8-oxo-dGTP diphosphatase